MMLDYWLAIITVISMVFVYNLGISAIKSFIHESSKGVRYDD